MDEKAQSTNKAVDTAIDLPSIININDYLPWFEKINLNTFFWQIIVLVALFYFGKEIKSFLKGIISKLPQLKSIAGAVFDLSPETKTELQENETRLEEEIRPYKTNISDDPNMVFLSNYINSERDLMELYMKAFNIDDVGPILTRTDKLIKELVEKKALNPAALSIHHDIKHARNKIAHGAKPFSSFEDAENYLKASLLLKDMIKEGLDKVSKK
jgi:hypothetical protein